ncbi:MAG: tRNA uridine-5-carboxymethylaminomethyl(34) synthesis GTPase MnmE [Candidatus Omnitrophota bacterium]
MNSNDTIAAVSTPLGEGGIGIIRISGDDALKIADKMFFEASGKKADSFQSHSVYYGSIVDTEINDAIDEVLLTVMKSPRSYTTEDVLEINCHGGDVNLKRILELCIRRGARLAEPGEFTKRAFLNGRIDLTQAEAVLDIISSKTEKARKTAFSQLKGAFSSEIRKIRKDMIEVISLVELGIDFSDEDVSFESKEGTVSKIKNIFLDMNRILDTSDSGIIVREGASVVICGRPNVGKSSLMNALLRDDRVIVTSLAGTTRDIIEEYINISGVKVRLSDTAGIIDTKDRVEIEGIKRSREKLLTSDIVIFVLDASAALSERDKSIFETIKDKKTVIVLNKADLPLKADIKKAHQCFGKDIIKVSALKKTGLDKLESAITFELFNGMIASTEGAVITNVRHKDLLKNASICVERTLKTAENDLKGELLASDLNEAVYHLGLITGESIGDDVLDRIFSKFCIGK